MQPHPAPTDKVVVLSPGYPQRGRDLHALADRLSRDGNHVPVLDHQWGGYSDGTHGAIDTHDGPARDLAAVAEIRSHDYPTEAVVAQEPAPQVAGDRVALLVNRGERAATYVMPDLIGVDGERAAEFLRRRGFRVAVTGAQPYPGVPAGVVLRQTPAGGFQIAPGQAIALEVSR